MPNKMQLDYQIIYSKRKTVTITVDRDRAVIVRAPEGTDPEKVRALVESKKLWLHQKLRHPQKYSPLPRHKNFISGASVLYLGQPYRLEIVRSPAEEIRFEGKFIVAAVSRERASKVFKEWYKARAKEIIRPRVQHHARNVGAHYNRVLISDLKYRWGSCTPNDNLNFNWKLIKAPMFVIDYVIVHELAHFLESNHTSNFWQIVKTQVPQYLKAKQWLKEHGEILEFDF